MQVTKIIDDRTPLDMFRRTHLVYHLRNHGVDVSDDLPAKNLRELVLNHNLPMPTPDSIQRKDSEEEKPTLETGNSNEPVEEEEVVFEPAEESVIDSMSRQELMKELAKKEIKFTMKMKNDELRELLANAENAS